MNKFSAIFLLIYLSTMSLAGNAVEKLLLTGAEITSDSSSYVFVGTAIPLPESTLAHGFVLHLWADFQKYSYDTLLPTNIIETEINVKANSFYAAIAYHDSGSNYWWNTKVGAIRGDAKLTPDDPNNKSKGNQTDLKLQIGGERHLTSTTKINGIIDYITDRDAYWARLRFLNLIDNNVYHGPEIITQGDPSYDAQQLGWVISGIAIQDHSTLGIKAGVRKGDASTSGYFGVELVVPY